MARFPCRALDGLRQSLAPAYARRPPGWPQTPALKWRPLVAAPRLSPHMPMPRPWILPRSRQRKLALLIGAVAIPALILALTAIWLTLGLAHQVEAESARYNTYLAEKVIEAFERELVDQVHGALGAAEH